MTPLEQKQKELIKRKCKHSPNCWINQNWDEARIAMSDTPNEFKDEGYFKALEEIEIKSHTCSCGLDELKSEIASLENQSEPEQISDAEITKIAISHQRQMCSVHPHAIIGTIEDAIHEFQSRLSLQAKETLRDETKEAIQFILDNPSQDEYVCQNWKPQIGNYGEITDDSVEVGKKWEKQLKLVLEYLKCSVTTIETKRR